MVSIMMLITSQQSTAQSSRLKIGADVPDITLKNLLNHPADSQKLHTFKGKFVILYFWNEGCSESIQNLPELMSLQEKFRDDIAIILVNDSQTKNEVERIYKDQKRFRKVDVTLPTVCDDKTLQRFFPRNSVPHIVWIDPAMKLLSVTREDQVNEANIAKLIGGEAVSMPVKDGIKYKVDFSKPLYLNGNGGNGDHLMFYSVLSNYYPGLYGGTTIDSTYGFISNFTVVNMLRYLFKSKTNRFGAQNFFPAARTRLEVKQPDQYAHKLNGHIPSENFYTYQFVSMKPLPYEKMRSLMLNDIKKYFGLDCYWTKAVKKCLVLTATDTAKLAWKGGEPIAGVSNTSIEANNLSVQELIDNIMAVTNYHHGPYPWVDETNFKGMMGEIKVNANIEDWQELANALHPFGLQLTLEEREVPILVIYEVDYHTPPANVQIAN